MNFGTEFASHTIVWSILSIRPLLMKPASFHFILQLTRLPPSYCEVNPDHQ